MFFERLQSLCDRDNTDVSGVLKALGLSTSKGTAWKGGAIPKGDILLRLANYFNVSTDYLLGNTDDPAPTGQKETPPAESEAADPVTQELYGIIGKMSRGQRMMLLEKAHEIKKI